MKTRLSLFICILLLSACSQRTDLAPIFYVDKHSKQHPFKTYYVNQGDTLYAIAFKYEMDYRDLATINQLNPPYLLKVGQPIRMVADKPIGLPKRSTNVTFHKIKVPKQAVKYEQWIWPVKGRLYKQFNLEKRQKGIDITAQPPHKVRVSQSGVVVYAGQGIPGYGQLIIVRHSRGYITAYGHNQLIRIKEGDRLKRGQVIADMGMINNQKWGVHFEIRKHGKPVNPLKFLKTG